MAASPGPLTDALLRLKQTYPLLAVEISTGTSDLLIGRLNEGRLDVVIGRMLTLPPRDYVFRPIGDEALSVIAAVDHPWPDARASVSRPCGVSVDPAAAGQPDA